PGGRRDAIDQLHSQLRVIAELGGDGVLTPASWGMFSLRLPPFTPPRGQREDRRVLLEALVELAPHAAAEGVWLAVEPINRYEDYMVNRIDQAVSLGEEVERQTGLGSVRVCADLFHMNIEEDDLPAAIRAAGPRIAHVHVDDTNRLQPGTGHMDFAAVFAALGDVGYDDWLTFECRLRGEPEEALPASARFLRQFL
ncbi:MAG TPA: sugar phosphate isomerase/epimerase family protein, partial [Actinomycetes bacterium]|nr:sugar phosphate isomerase/epimerase family protein [Actinomycetes bacterium]